MFDHFSHSELACRTIDQVRLASGFGEALEQLRIKFEALGSPYKIISAVSGNSKRPRYSALTCFASGSEA